MQNMFFWIANSLESCVDVLWALKADMVRVANEHWGKGQQNWGPKGWVITKLLHMFIVQIEV